VYWEQVRANACANSKDGGLPPFEAALQAMSDARNLDACSCDPSRDYSQLFKDPQYLLFNSRDSYNSPSSSSPPAHKIAGRIRPVSEFKSKTGVE
jgi:hypothetical protein